jgi:tetratricopeptide (TPR) repeat protein
VLHLHQNKTITIAYTYFKLKEYDQAATYFQNQIEIVKEDKVRLTDSYLRLGDCQFVLQNIGLQWRHIIAIDMKGVDADYAYYQKQFVMVLLPK